MYDFPANPVPGDEFTPPVGGQTYVWHPPRWLVKGIPPTAGGGGSGIDEAPVDTKQYGRQDAAWTQIPPNATWSTLAGKPATFPPTLPILEADVTNLVQDLASKVNLAGDTMTGVLAMPVGTAALPSVNFGAAGTGIYGLAGGTQFNVAVSGVNKITVGTTAIPVTIPFRQSSGVVGAPSYTFNLDTTSGLYMPAAASVAMTVSGTQMMSWTASTVTAAGTFVSQYIKVGTTDNTSGGTGLLMLKRASGYSETIAFSDGAGGQRGGINMTPAGVLTFRVGDNSTDDVSIGTNGSIGTTGTVTSAPPAGSNAEFFLQSASGQTSNIWFKKTGGLSRWVWSMTSAAESTGNAGSNIAITRYADDGVTGLGAALTITRSTGIVDMPLGATTVTQVSTDNSTKVATTAFVITAAAAKADKTYVDTQDAAVAAAAVAKAGDTMTGPLSMPVGTAAAAAINFGTPGTGIYSAASATQVNITAGGAQRFTVANNVIVVAVAMKTINGSAAAPAYTFTADTTSGLYMPAAASVAMTVSGAQVMSWSATTVTSTVPVVLPANPVNPLEAATKQYVDTLKTISIAMPFPGKPAAAGMLILPVTFPITVASALVGTAGFAYTAPTATVSFTLYKVTSAGAETIIGTVGVTAATKTGFVLAGSGGSLVVGDSLMMKAPVTQDATLSDITITLQVTRA